MKRFPIFLGLLIFCLFASSCSSGYRMTQVIRGPDGRTNYCLYHKAEFRFDEFMIMRVPSSLNPKSCADSIDDRELSEQEMLKCKDESQQLMSNSTIELLDKRFLVFSREGLYFSLYDLKLDKAIYNEFDPFYLAMVESSDYATWAKATSINQSDDTSHPKSNRDSRREVSLLTDDANKR